MRIKARKWGNSLALRIPKALAEEARIVDGEDLDLKLNNGKLVLVPVARKKLLEELISKINSENLHDQLDFGAPKGKEIW